MTNIRNETTDNLLKFFQAIDDGKEVTTHHVWKPTELDQEAGAVVLALLENGRSPNKAALILHHALHMMMSFYGKRLIKDKEE